MSDLIAFADVFLMIAVPIALLLLAAVWGTTWLDKRWQRRDAEYRARRAAAYRDHGEW